MTSIDLKRVFETIPPKRMESGDWDRYLYIRPQVHILPFLPGEDMVGRSHRQALNQQASSQQTANLLAL